MDFAKVKRVIHPIISRAGNNPAEQLYFHFNPGKYSSEKININEWKILFINQSSSWKKFKQYTAICVHQPSTNQLNKCQKFNIKDEW